MCSTVEASEIIGSFLFATLNPPDHRPQCVLFVIAVFFVYKLFRCLKDREIKREEKKKNKQLKKKK